MKNYRWFVCFLFASTRLVSVALGSQESIGPKGINSIAIPLDGDGIPIGQVEGKRSGKWDYDLAANSSEFIDPFFVLRQNMTSVSDEDIDDHATWVAGVMISSEPTGQKGVAPGAALVSAGFRSPIAGIGPHEDILTTTQAVATSFLDDTLVRAINHSYGFFSSDPGGQLDGNTFFTAGIDWVASRYDVLNVVAGNEFLGGLGSYPTDNFNGMTIGASAKNSTDGFYREVAGFNLYTADSVGPRTSIDLIAPGEDIEMIGPGNNIVTRSGTSFAAPHVTGTVALLQKHASNAGWGTNARRHEVMKAVLMNSADKLKDNGDGNLLGMTRTVLDSNGNDWLASAAANNALIPVDDEFGAGHLNADRAFKQFQSAEQDADGADVSVIGWDYGTPTTIFDDYRYAIEEPLRQGSRLAVTLTWDRIVDFDL